MTISFRRFLQYETNNNSEFADYGEVVTIINDKMVNVNIGGERDSAGNLLILEAVSVEGNYVPKIGDWVTIQWRNNQPVAIGGESNGMSTGLTNINQEVKIVSQSDMANGVINSDHIRANSIEAIHITAQSIQAGHISANAITSTHISAGAITAGKLAADSVTAVNISAGAITSVKIAADAITSVHISANSITGSDIQANAISGNHIVAGSVDAGKLNISAREQGLLGQYFTHTGGANKFETFKGSAIETTLNQNWTTGSPSIVGQADNYAVRYQGLIFSPEAGSTWFELIANDGLQLWVDNTLVATASGNTVTGSISLLANKWYTIRLDYYELTGSASFSAKWKLPSQGSYVDIPSQNLTQSQTVIDGGTILTNTITAGSMKVGTITAASGVIGDLAITTANIINGAITSAKIGNAEVKTANIANANITTALIADASITNAKIVALDAGKITTGYLSAALISAGTIVGSMISAGTITGTHISANSIDTNQIKAGAITTVKLAAQTITGDKIAADTITGTNILAGTIAAEHIITKGLDANLVNVYNSATGQVLIGGGYVRVDGLDVGVVQSDNLIGNGLFLTASSAYGMKRDNQAGEAILGNVSNLQGAHEVWKINTSTGAKVAALSIPAKKPFDISIDTSEEFAYITVQGDDSLVQVDLANFTLTDKALRMGVGPSNIMYTGDALGDMKHFFILNSDPTDKNVPDSVIVIDAPPASSDNDLYVHHWWEVGNTPYDMVLDSNKILFISQAGQGDIAVVDVSAHNSLLWKVVGTIPIAAYMTDNYHGGLSGVFGLGIATGGDSAAAYDANAKASTTSSSEHAGHVHSGYGSPTGSLKQYEPHGIALSADSDTLYVCDYKNNELLIVDKYGKAPYNGLTGLHSQANMGEMGEGMGMPMNSGGAGGMDHDMFVGSPATAMFMDGGGPTTRYVRYRIPIGNSPDYVTVANGKIFVSLQGSGKIAVIDEQDIIDEIEADRAFYYAQSGDVPYEENPFNPMRDLPTFSVRTIDVGSKPSKMIPKSGVLFAVISGQNQVKRIDITNETILSTINTGPNPKGITFSADGAYAYVVNHGGSGDFSFVYPQGPYIGDAFIGLEGGINLQGADFWLPDRSDWVYDASGNIHSYSTIEFRINEPFLNEGGYTKMSLVGKEYQYTSIEQDIYTVTNYSNGNNLVVSTDERLAGLDTGNTIFQPRNPWLSSPTPTFKVFTPLVGGGFSSAVPATNQYTVLYGDNARITFSGGVVPSGGYVTSTYTARNNIYFKPHNASIIVAAENGSSPNFTTAFEVDEMVPKFFVFDNQQTASFTPTADGISETYTGLEYSYATNRALGKTVTASATPLSTSVEKATFAGKVVASTTQNPHVSKNTATAILTSPLVAWFAEETTTQYTNISTLNGTLVTHSNSVNTNIMQQLFTFNLIEHVIRKYGVERFGSAETVAERVAWLKANITKITPNWHGYGSGPSGNKVSSNIWDATGASWTTFTVRQHTNGTVTKLTPDVTTPTNIGKVIDVNGNIHVIVYADASNGTISSVINTDYIEVLIELPAVSTSLSVVSDGAQIDEEHGDHTAMDMFGLQEYVTLSGNQYVTIDLGSKYMIGKVTVSHMYETDRIYQGTKTQVSEDGTTWTTVYDSAVAGTYNEKASYHSLHGHTHYAKVITFPSLPVRYIRDYANGWVSGDGYTSGTESHWTDIKAYGDWAVEENYVYPAGMANAGQQMATNNKCVVTTDVQDAYIAYDAQIEFTSWWYMTYLVGPEFGRLKVEMPSMGGDHYLNLDAPYLNKIAHRHIMPWTPSQNIKENTAMGIKAGKHRAVIRQVSGKVSVDRFRIEDFQKLTMASLDVSNQTVSNYSRKKIVAEQAKWYEGQGKQSTEGAYDRVRTNPDTGLPDNSVPIKYRVRIKSELNPVGGVEERGISYITSAIFETGKLHTHWRRSESVDKIPANRIQNWDANQPHNTGIQHTHLANGSVRGTKILPQAIMDYHISPYARIEEFKLNLKHPTHRHGRTVVTPSGGPMGTDLYTFVSNLDFLDTIIGYAGSGGVFGTDNTVARGNHTHDYLGVSGTAINAEKLDNLDSTQFLRSDTSGTLTGGLTITTTLGVTGNTTLRGTVNVIGSTTVAGLTATSLTVNGNIAVTGTVDGVDVSTLNTTVTNHIGSGGAAHALATASVHGFLSSTDFSKLAGIQASAISQATADGRYLQLSGGTLTGNVIMNVASGDSAITLQTAGVTKGKLRVNATGLTILSATGGGVYLRPLGDTDTAGEFRVSTAGAYWAGNAIWHAGNFNPSDYYTKTQTDGLIAAAGNIRAENANVFTYAGTAVKIQPSANVAANTKMFLINDYLGAEKFSVDAEGDVTVKGNLTVEGTTQYAGTTVIQGDYTVEGNFGASGNSILNTATITTLTIPTGGVIKQIGKEVEVMRFPVFGIGSDMQFQSDSTTFDKILTHYNLFSTSYAMPTVPSGATRKYKYLVSYSTSTTNACTFRTVQNGTSTEIMSYTLPNVQGAVDGTSRTILTPAFTTSFTGHVDLQAKSDTAGTLAIKYIEVIAYDVY